MLDHLGHGGEAAAVESAVQACVREGAAPPTSAAALTTSAAGDAVCERLLPEPAPVRPRFLASCYNLAGRRPFDYG